jgi:hypothetical protein
VVVRPDALPSLVWVNDLLAVGCASVAQDVR